MIGQRFFAHASPGGPNLSARVRAARYIGAGTRRWGLGENLGIGSGAAAAPLSMLRTWMASSPHRANVLHGRFRELGTGLIAGLPTGGGGLTYTTDFGFRRR